MSETSTVSEMTTVEVPLNINGVEVLNVISTESTEGEIDEGKEQNKENEGEEQMSPAEKSIEIYEKETVGKESPKANSNTDQTDKAEKLVRLPVARIKHLMKMDPEVSLATQEAVFLITKATELFIESLAKEAYNFTTKSKRKTVQRRDIDAVIEAVDTLVFLESVLDDLC